MKAFLIGALVAGILLAFTVAHCRQEPCKPGAEISTPEGGLSPCRSF